MQIHLFDTTLRDGTQSEGLSLSVEDKLKIAKLLDSFGIHFIEGGYPGSNPKDIEFFRRAKTELNLRHAKLTAFGSTRRAGTPAGEDLNLRTLVEAFTPTVCIYGKSWAQQVTRVLGTSLDENLRMIGDSVALLKTEGKEVVYDAEHFFDGFRADHEYALATLRAAYEQGADWIVLCDTNGGCLPGFVAEVVTVVRRALPTRLGIHAHNDADLAVANTLAAVDAGCTQIQGTINGWGERCGNANLMSVIPTLQLKVSHRCVTDGNLACLTSLSRTVSGIANIRPSDQAPYVGTSAFAYKEVTHTAALIRLSTYQHILPDNVGNQRRVVASAPSFVGNVPGGRISTSLCAAWRGRFLNA
jgi:2-isopropylmalate synthase